MIQSIKQAGKFYVLIKRSWLNKTSHFSFKFSNQNVLNHHNSAFMVAGMNINFENI